MEISDLEIFRMIAKEGSINKAAKELSYVQSNVTARIKRLEDELKMPLFYRHSRGVTLTPPGKKLLEYSDKIFSLLGEAKNAIGINDIPRGSLTIGAIESATVVRLPPILSSYMKQYPEVDLTIRIGYTEELIDAVLNYQVDGAFIVGHVDHPELLKKTFIEEELVLITDSEHSVLNSYEDINSRILFTLKPGCIYRKQLLRWLEEEGIPPLKIMQFSSLEAILGCVRAGLGISLLSKTYVDNFRLKQGLQYHSVPEKFRNLSTVFIYRKDVLMTSALNKFLLLSRILETVD